MKPSVVISGYGVVTPYGIGTKALAVGLAERRTALRTLDDIPNLSGAPVDREAVDAALTASERSKLDPFARYTLLAAREAFAMANLRVAPSARRGAIIGSTNGGHEIVADQFRRLLIDGKSRLSPLTLPRSMLNAAASAAAKDLALKGPVFGLASACASGVHAIAVGAQLIQAGIADLMVVGGADSVFMPSYLQAWRALGVVDGNPCRPFADDRNGLSLSEGAGVLILENGKNCADRGGEVLGQLVGAGMSSDAGHLLSPDKDGMVRAMEGALEQANLTVNDICFVNAHGTGTESNDAAEAQAIAETFGTRGVPVTSTKAFHGHMMGAAGAVEAIITLMDLVALEVTSMPKENRNTLETIVTLVDGTTKHKDGTAALTNSFGFGGLNGSLVLLRP